MEISIGSRCASPTRDGCDSSGQKGREIKSPCVHVLGKGTRGPCEISRCLAQGIETTFFFFFYKFCSSSDPAGAGAVLTRCQVRASTRAPSRFASPSTTGLRFRRGTSPLGDVGGAAVCFFSSSGVSFPSCPIWHLLFCSLLGREGSTASLGASVTAEVSHGQ